MSLNKELKINNNILFMQNVEITSKIEKDGIVLDDKMMEELSKQASVKDLPDPVLLTQQIIEIQEYMCTDEMILLQKNNFNVYEQNMRNKFSNFAEKYHSIFKLLIKGDDISMLIMMLQGINDVKNGHITMESLNKSIDVETARKYLLPSLSKKQIKKIEKKMNIKF